MPITRPDTSSVTEDTPKKAVRKRVRRKKTKQVELDLTTEKTSANELFNAARTELNTLMIERQDDIDIALTALLCGHHYLMIGPPGTGKSLLSRHICSILEGSYFEVLLTKFTTPEELFGPWSLQGMKEDRYVRITDNTLVDAEVSFVDEIFKASSSILNTLLQILNERTFRNGPDTTVCPLKLAIGASNEWPAASGSKELAALFDRFLFRKPVQPIMSADGRQRLIWDVNGHVPETKITVQELQNAREEVHNLGWSKNGKEAFEKIWQNCRDEGILPSDRRMQQGVQACQAYAWLEGSRQVEPDDLVILTHICWVDPTEQPDKVAEIVGTVANPIRLRVNDLLIQVQQTMNGYKKDDLSNIVETTTKLNDILKELRKLPKSRTKDAVDFVKKRIATIKREATESLL